ncbi:aspartate-rich protein 1-like isoform X5 [Macaca fascicularis]|uniref:aspartate-rich protein 1-like isoform X5 n=1 Tax=Macaca fascicularis TaxID=9541 RepID=UPI003D15CED9
MPTGHPEDSLRLKSLPPSEEDNDDAQILPSPVLAFSMDNLSLVCLPPSEDDDWGDDDGDDDVQILPSPVLAPLLCHPSSTQRNSPVSTQSILVYQPPPYTTSSKAP